MIAARCGLFGLVVLFCGETEFGELGAVLRQYNATDRDHAGHKETTDSLARSFQKFINFLLVPIA